MSTQPTEERAITWSIITRWTCDHLSQGDSGSIERWLKRPDPRIANPPMSAQEDWDFALKIIAKRLNLTTPGFETYPDHLEALRICWECSDTLPSERAKVHSAATKVVPTEQDTTELQDILDTIDAGGEVPHFCHGCNEFKEEADLVELRECPHCDEIFDGNEGRNCPSCNRPFTRKLEGLGCPDCLDSYSLPEEATAELVKGMMTP